MTRMIQLEPGAVHILRISSIESAIDDNHGTGVLIFDPQRGTHWRRMGFNSRGWCELETGLAFYKVGPDLLSLNDESTQPKETTDDHK